MPFAEALAIWAKEGRKAGAPESVVRWQIVAPGDDPRPILRWLKLEGDTQADGTLRVVETVLPPGASPYGAPLIPGLEAAPSSGLPSEPSLDARISVSLSNVPLKEALKYISALVNYSSVAGADGIRLYACSNQPRGPLIFRKTKVPPSFFSRLGKGATAVNGRIDARLFLYESGVCFCEGSRAEYVTAKSELRTLLLQDQDDLLEPMFIACSIAPPTLRQRLQMAFEQVFRH